MKVKDPDVVPVGPWHSWRVGFFPKRTYDGRWLLYGVVARRRVQMVNDKLCPASRERWQYADLDQVLGSAP
jgi:hypothetical protein